MIARKIMALEEKVPSRGKKENHQEKIRPVFPPRRVVVVPGTG